MIENNMTHHTHPDSCFLTSNASHFYGITAFELITTLRRVLEGTTTGRRSIPDRRAHPLPVPKLEPKWRMACYSYSPRGKFPSCAMQIRHWRDTSAGTTVPSGVSLKPCVCECGDVTLPRLVSSGFQSNYVGLEKTVQWGRKFKKHLQLLLNYSVWVWNLVPSWLSLEDRRKKLELTYALAPIAKGNQKLFLFQ